MIGYYHRILPYQQLSTISKLLILQNDFIDIIFQKRSVLWGHKCNESWAKYYANCELALEQIDNIFINYNSDTV